MYHIFCIHSSVEGHLGSFQVLANVNKAAMNIVEYVSLWYGGASFGYIVPEGCATISQVYVFHDVHRGLICDSQKLETTQMSHSKLIDTENVVHLHNGILLRYYKQ